MGKVSKKQQHTNHHDRPGKKTTNIARRHHGRQTTVNKKLPQSGKLGDTSNQQTSNKSGPPKRINVPFTSNDKILLVGEGDFSFTLSLAQHYNVKSIVATCFDSRQVLEDKYPGVKKTLLKLQPTLLQQSNGEENHTTKDKNKTTAQDHDHESEAGFQGFSSSSSSEKESDNNNNNENHTTPPLKPSKVNIYFGIDATKLNTTHKKILKPHTPFTKIVFNFPHVGGLSTDVNRQVRANQELLVSFFNAAKPLLATSSSLYSAFDSRSDDLQDHHYHHQHHQFDSNKDKDNDTYGSEDDDDYDNDNGSEDNPQPLPTPPSQSQILTTIFTTEPYTLWNIRDLARHSGLKVLESFKFPWVAYPGYRHARTIGEITSGKDRRGNWRGEDRDARCFCFVLNDADSDRDGGGEGDGGQMKMEKKRKRMEVGEDRDSDSDSD